MRFLCIFAMARTGSTHLDKLLKSCSGIISKSELFHSNGKTQFSQSELAELQTASNGAASDKLEFARWRRRNPAETLDALARANRSGTVIFKVLPNHLERKRVESQLFPRTDVGFAVLSRRPIECFISYLKAMSLSRFATVDTTSIKPVLAADDFFEWAGRMKQWHEWLYRSLDARGAPYAKISYERHLDGLSGKQSLSRILPLLEPSGVSGIEIPENVAESRRQDKEARYPSRVANWNEFVAEAGASPEREVLLKWAETVT